MGRPKKYQSEEELQSLIDAYFDNCDMDEKPYTLSGLAVYLDIDRDTLLNYSKDEKFFGTIKRAKARCQQFAEEKLFGGANAAGVIFNLKNNYGWKDKTETELSGGLGGNIEININRNAK